MWAHLRSCYCYVHTRCHDRHVHTWHSSHPTIPIARRRRTSTPAACYINILAITTNFRSRSSLRINEATRSDGGINNDASFQLEAVWHCQREAEGRGGDPRPIPYATWLGLAGLPAHPTTFFFFLPLPLSPPLSTHATQTQAQRRDARRHSTAIFPSPPPSPPRSLLPPPLSPPPHPRADYQPHAPCSRGPPRRRRARTNPRRPRPCPTRTPGLTTTWSRRRPAGRTTARGGPPPPHPPGAGRDGGAAAAAAPPPTSPPPPPPPAPLPPPPRGRAGSSWSSGTCSRAAWRARSAAASSATPPPSPSASTRVSPPPPPSLRTCILATISWFVNQPSWTVGGGLGFRSSPRARRRPPARPRFDSIHAFYRLWYVGFHPPLPPRARTASAPRRSGAGFGAPSRLVCSRARGLGRLCSSSPPPRQL